MALFKVFRGKSTALDSVKKVDGHAYFCIDDGSFWIDYTEENGTLNRKSIGRDQWTAAIENAIAAIRAEFEEKLETKTDYLGVVSSMSELSTIAGAGDYHRVQADFTFGNEIAHAGDLLIAVINLPIQTAECWDLVHTGVSVDDLAPVAKSGLIEDLEINWNTMLIFDGGSANVQLAILDETILL